MRIFSLFLVVLMSGNLFAQKIDRQYVVVVSLDGFRADYPEKFHAQNILNIAKQGVRVKRMIPSNPTKTFPNHYTLATGLYPEHHGLVGNAFYAPYLQKEYNIRMRNSVEDGRFYGGEPIWNTAEKAGIRTASYFWVGSEAKIKGIQPSIWKKYSTKVPLSARIDSVINWLQKPYKERPHLVMLYYHEPDRSGHHFGTGSQEVAKQVQFVDEQIGNLHQKLMQLPIADSINLVLVSDHGMRNISADKQIILEDYVNPKWIKGVYGSNPVYTITANPEKCDSVYRALRKIKHLKVYKQGKVPRRLRFGNTERFGDFVIVGKKGWSVFPKHFQKTISGGTHGYLNSDKQMAALFVAKGAAFKSGYTKRSIKNVDIYNLLAKILELQPAPNDGKFRRVRGLLKK